MMKSSHMRRFLDGVDDSAQPWSTGVAEASCIQLLPSGNLR